ncbi:hypothetical protein IC582_031306 [Cucumis melo]
MAEALEYKSRPWARAPCVNGRAWGARCTPMRLRGACAQGAARAMRLRACVGRASQAQAMQWGVRVGCRTRHACASVGIRLRGVRSWLVSGR